LNSENIAIINFFPGMLPLEPEKEEALFADIFTNLARCEINIQKPTIS